MGSAALAVKVTEAGDMLSVSRATVYNLINGGHLRTVKILGSTRITVASIQALASDGTKVAAND